MEDGKIFMEHLADKACINMTSVVASNWLKCV